MAYPVIAPVGIASAEAFGDTCEEYFLAPEFVAEEICFPDVRRVGLAIRPEGIPPGEIGIPAISVGEGCVIARIGGSTIPIREGSLNISDHISRRSTADFTVMDTQNAYTFHRGQTVVINDRRAVRVFGGVIHSALRVYLRDGVYEHQISCADNHYFADKRIAAQVYRNLPAGDIVQALHATYLADEGITLGTIQSGPLILEQICNYEPVTDSLDKLARVAGFQWMIDEYKRLHFAAPNAFSAPVPFSSDMMLYGSVTVSEQNARYRNRQYIKGGKAITDPQIETQFGDGELQAFALRFPVATVPTVEIDIGAGFIPQTVGIKGLETGRNWYWSKGDPIIAQDELGVTLTDTDRIRVTYQGQTPIVVISQRNDEVLRMQSLQGGTGRVEDVQSDSDIDTREAAFQQANSYLDKYSGESSRVQFDTLSYGLSVGDTVTLIIPEYGINRQYVVEELTIWQQNKMMYYRAVCVAGPYEGSWQEFYEDLFRRGKPFTEKTNIGEDEILITLAGFSDAVEISEIVTVTPLACPIIGPATIIGPALIIC